MGRSTFTTADYTRAKAKLTEEGKSATSRGQKKVEETGKLDPLVDPAEFGVVRESRIRFSEMPNGFFEVNVGTPVPIEYRLDTTGSMGNNVEKALRALPSICEPVATVLPGRDPQYCASIFGDVCDKFILCRGQFEMLAERMVGQLTLMHPEGGGGDAPEAPYYGIFGAAYLTKAYIRLVGLKSYDFTITDAPGRESFVLDHLKRVFGPHVLDKAKENGYEISDKDLPTVSQVVQDMLKHTHAFVLLVGTGAKSYWDGLYGKERVVILPEIEYVPHVMASIIGLSEGTLDLSSVKQFLISNNLKEEDATKIVSAISGIPLGAQCLLPNFSKMPVKGDIFRSKTDLWPISPDELASLEAEEESDQNEEESDEFDVDNSGGWL